MKNLGQFPNEILSLILDQVNHEDLYTCAFINKNFYTATTPFLWRTLTVYDDDKIKILTTSLLESQPQNSLGHHVRHLALGYFAMTDSLLLQWMPRMPNLEKLEIPSAQLVTDIGFQHITQNCPKLQSLQLHYGIITQHSIRALGYRCHLLCELDLFGCTNLSNDTFSVLLDCPLEKLTLGMNYSFSLDWMTVEETLVDLLRYDLLTNLSLIRTTAPFMKHLLLSSTTTTIPWPHLTRLTLEEYDNLHEHELIGFIKCHPQLRSLALISMDLTDVTLDAISTYLSHGVTCIDISRNRKIAHQGLRRMIYQCYGLTCVSLYGCDQTMADFPEAGTECVEALVRRRPLELHERYVHQLDQDAINCIRKG